MRNDYFFLLFPLMVCQSAFAQSGSTLPDTLIAEPVIGNPLANMLPVPSGSDDLWINYDQDLLEGFCVMDDVTPFGWYIDADFGFLDPSETDNDAFTSCSYLDGGVRNHNWLILPPILVPDDSYQLCWRSLPFEGPAFMDGYKVVASTASNLPASNDFSHVLFTAAETIKPVVPNVYTLNPADYVFSPGYIHANGYTDTSYFFLAAPEGPYRGRLEPHCISLAAFAGLRIYIAFHHDSKDDSQLQLDDILVSNDNSVAAFEPLNVLDFSIIPNPATSNTYVKWRMVKPEAGRMLLRDQSGKLVLEKAFSAFDQGQLFLNLEHFAAGIYHCTLQTASGQTTRKLVKM